MSKLLKLIFTKRNNSIFFLVVDHSCSKEKDSKKEAALPQQPALVMQLQKSDIHIEYKNSQAVKKCSPKEPR